MCECYSLLSLSASPSLGFASLTLSPVGDVSKPVPALASPARNVSHPVPGPTLGQPAGAAANQRRALRAPADPSLASRNTPLAPSSPPSSAHFT